MNCCEKSASLPKCCEGCRCELESCPGILSQNSCYCEYVCGCDGCGCFDSRLRDSFWPHFSHPRWLSLESLYSGSTDGCACVSGNQA